MARIEEATLFRPDSKLQYPGAPRGGGGGGGGGGRSNDEDDGPNIALGARVGEAARSAKRRKGLSFVVMMICGALTVLGAIFAPRSYEVESRVLVQKTSSLTGPQQQYVSPEEMRNLAREYEEQVLARDNILAIVKQKNLVARWDDMRQPHRRLIDKINRKLGKPAPSDDEKFEALVSNIEHRMKVWVDATTVTVKLEWSEPLAARDIVDAAVKNFLDARFQSEVGVIPARLKIQEGFVAQAHKDLESAATELVRLQKANDPTKKINVLIPQLPQGVNDKPVPIDADPALKAKLEGVRGQIQTASQAKQQRLAELNQQLIEKQQTLAPGHPEVIGLKQTIAATEASQPAGLAGLKAQEQEILNEMAAQQQRAQAAAKAEARPVPRTVSVAAPAPPPEVIAATAPKSVQDAQVRFDTVTATYQTLVKQLQELQVQMQEQEAQYKNRYKITHPAEVPAGPKRPVALIAIAIGLLSTIAAVLMVAALADRFSGIFFEPRDVRDRLGLPVFATFS
ncbi:MAG: Chain length determinant protein [Labilithrix sp.]|nr:Chain length determinant protein [Labilithrix sp.]